MFALLISPFLLFALSRTILRYKDGTLSIGGLLFWVTVWAIAGVITWWPKLTVGFAARIGIGRGVDSVIYPTMLLILYLIFRLYIKISRVDHEISRLVRALAIKDSKK